VHLVDHLPAQRTIPSSATGRCRHGSRGSCSRDGRNRRLGHASCRWNSLPRESPPHVLAGCCVLFGSWSRGILISPPDRTGSTCTSTGNISVRPPHVWRAGRLLFGSCDRNLRWHLPFYTSS